ncbi:MAG: pyridoxamine 5'-phosphate oxidase family protein [Candidatus Helarchaeota archaeon]|nr:pyridoxamine 5'-phosphate oxidase family protein [Candidatus Helarchaeota archaeon]
MRRNEKEIKDKELIKNIIEKSTVCRIAMALNNSPYIVPVIFGYEDNFLYIHSAPEGKKIEILKQNNNVCFEMDINHEIVKSDTPCKWSMNYYSIIGYGKASFINDFQEKINAMNIIMKHYSSSNSHKYYEKIVNNLAIIKIEIEKITGKKSGY